MISGQLYDPQFVLLYTPALSPRPHTHQTSKLILNQKLIYLSSLYLCFNLFLYKLLYRKANKRHVP